MRKLSLLALLLLLVAGSAHAQSSSVSIQVTDSGGVAWANGTVTFSYVGAPNPTWSGGNLPLSITATLNSSGAATQSVPDTNTITPGPASWALRICPQVGISAQCINQSPIAITGATPTLTLTPPAIQIQASTNFPISAYADAELVNVSLGFTFFNTVNGGTPGLRVCTAVSGTNCTSWSTVGPSGGGGGVCPAGAAGNIQYTNGTNCASTSELNYNAGTDTLSFTPAIQTFVAPIEIAFGAGAGNNAVSVDLVNGIEMSALEPTSGSIIETAFTNITRSAPEIVDTVGNAAGVTPGSVTQRVVTGTTDTILNTDRTNRVAYNSTTAVAVSLPTAGSTGFAGGFNTRISNQNTGTVTITPATGTINGNATLVLLEGQFCFVSPSSAGTSYAADCGESQMTAGTGISFTRAVHGLTITATGLQGITFPQTVAGTVNSGGIPYFNSTTQMSSSAAGTVNTLMKWGGAGNPPLGSICTDNATSLACAGAVTSTTEVDAGANSGATGVFGLNGATSGKWTLTGSATGTTATANGNFSVGSNTLTGGVVNATSQLQLFGKTVNTSGAPTILTGGCGGSGATISNAAANYVFDVNVGTGPTSAGCTLTFPGNTIGWVVSCNDQTTQSATVFVQKQTGAVSTTSVVIQTFAATGSASAPAASDVYHCTAAGH